MLEKLVSFCHQSRTCGCGQPRDPLIRILNERSVSDWKLFSSVVGDSQISLIIIMSETHFSCEQLAVSSG